VRSTRPSIGSSKTQIYSLTCLSGLAFGELASSASVGANSAVPAIQTNHICGKQPYDGLANVFQSGKMKTVSPLDLSWSAELQSIPTPDLQRSPVAPQLSSAPATIASSLKRVFTFRRKLSICGCLASTRSKLRNAALGLARDGVGHDPRSNFIHDDVGRVRNALATALSPSWSAISPDTDNPLQELFRAQRRARRCHRKNERFHPQLRRQYHIRLVL